MTDTAALIENRTVCTGWDGQEKEANEHERSEADEQKAKHEEGHSQEVGQRQETRAKGANDRGTLAFVSCWCAVWFLLSLTWCAAMDSAMFGFGSDSSEGTILCLLIHFHVCSFRPVDSIAQDCASLG